MKLIVDIDGTLLNGNNVLHGAIEFIHYLKSHEIEFLLMTNSIKDCKSQAERLAEAGFEIPINSILNPVAAINRDLKQREIKAVRIFGSEYARQQVAPPISEKEYEATILLDFEKMNATYNDFQSILEDLEKEIPVLTASKSLYYHAESHKKLDTGAFVNMLELVSHKEIKNFGKPSLNYFSIAGEMLKAKPENIMVIGDDWKTDGTGAAQWGAIPVLVKSGKYESGDEQNVPRCRIADSLADLIDNTLSRALEKQEEL